MNSQLTIPVIRCLSLIILPILKSGAEQSLLLPHLLLYPRNPYLGNSSSESHNNNYIVLDEIWQRRQALATCLFRLQMFRLRGFPPCETPPMAWVGQSIYRVPRPVAEARICSWTRPSAEGLFPPQKSKPSR
jgi:hypothetical protein